jgi:hypothetical protein
MPQNLANNNVYSGTVVAPSNGDLLTDASFTAGLQPLTNRTTFLYTRLNTGVLRIRTAATEAALKALTGMADGDVAVIAGAGGMRGMYVFLAGVTTAESSPQVIAPSTGTGRWFLHTYALHNQVRGYAMLDASARLPVAQLPAVVPGAVLSYGINEHIPAPTLTFPSFGSDSLYDPGVSTIGTLAAGQRVRFSGQISWRVDCPTAIPGQYCIVRGEPFIQSSSGGVPDSNVVVTEFRPPGAVESLNETSGEATLHFAGMVAIASGSYASCRFACNYGYRNQGGLNGKLRALKVQWEVLT